MTIKEMRAAKDRQKIGEEITPADMAPVESVPSDTAEKPKTTPKRSAKKTKDTPKKISATEKIIEDAPEIIEETPHALPSSLYEDIRASIDFYCQNENITDTKKIHPLEWQGICCMVGESIKQRGLLHDRQREKTHGGTVYDGEKMSSLLDIYGVICSYYKQVAFTFNFARFAGVSTDYLHDYMNKGLTSARVGLRQKALEMQKASLVSAVTGGGSATVGNIFLSKALAGLQETVTVQHVSAAAAPTTSALPVLDSSGGGLIESKTD